MHKNLFKGFLVLAAAACVGSAATGCSKKENDPNTLNIVCLDKGYGRVWIDELVKIWEAENPDYKIKLDATSEATATMEKNLSESDNIDDLYIGNTYQWKTWALEGDFLELDSFLDEEVEKGVKVRDKVNVEYQPSLKFHDHTYRLPWISGVPGIYYNAQMFEDHGWNPPEDVQGLIDLCAQIKAAAVAVDDENEVKPFIYTGENEDYFDYAVFTWWAQLAGENNVRDYLKYNSAATFSSSHPAFNALGQALGFWNSIFGDPTNFVANSASYSNHMAQQSFYNGYAAMMINCDWIYNEIAKTYKTFRPGFKLELMKTPVATGAVDENISYIVGEEQFIAIPSTSIKVDLAKSFIKLMISDRGLKNFAKNAHGSMAYKLTEGESYDVSDKYTKSLIDYLDNCPRRFTSWSSSDLFLNNIIMSPWSDGQHVPYTRILNHQPNYSTPAECMARISENASSSWSDWQRRAGQ